MVAVPSFDWRRPGRRDDFERPRPPPVHESARDPLPPLDRAAALSLVHPPARAAPHPRARTVSRTSVERRSDRRDVDFVKPFSKRRAARRARAIRARFRPISRCQAPHALRC
jgi:hypothetical protein